MANENSWSRFMFFMCRIPPHAVLRVFPPIPVGVYLQTTVLASTAHTTLEDNHGFSQRSVSCLPRDSEICFSFLVNPVRCDNACCHTVCFFRPPYPCNVGKRFAPRYSVKGANALQVEAHPLKAGVPPAREQGHQCRGRTKPLQRLLSVRLSLHVLRSRMRNSPKSRSRSTAPR